VTWFVPIVTESGPGKECLKGVARQVPNYDYRCEDGHVFEKFQSMSDEKLTACEICGKKVERLLGTGGGIIFKGTGFHCKDYPSKK